MTDYCAEQESPWDPLDYLQELKDREFACRELIDLLQIRASSDECTWRHHLPRILDPLHFFRGLCQEEIDHFGEWRYYNFQIDEVIDFIDEDLNQLEPWICRLIGPGK